MSRDPARMGRRLAAFVRDNHLDGVDVDYEQVPYLFFSCHSAALTDRLVPQWQYDTMENGEVGSRTQSLS